MTVRYAFASKTDSCRSTAAVAASSARIRNNLDTAVHLAVSICVVSILCLRLLICGM